MTTKTFHDLGVAEVFTKRLEEQSITEPFPIQDLTIPLALGGADLIGQARTGTGKTLAFGLPLLQRIETGTESVRALVVTPTRELCLQVADDIADAGRDIGVRVLTVYGGVAFGPQVGPLRSREVDVVVGTPGRLLDLVRRGDLVLGDVEILVLDEADRMLDMGFLPDVTQLVEACGTDRQTLLFSATMPNEVVKLARSYMRSPTFIRADEEELELSPETKQHFFVVHRMDKPRIVARILQSPDAGLSAVFVRTKRMADQLVSELRDLGVQATPIHGDLRQERRERNLERFRAGRSEVLVATEVAARGLDIEGITHVVNYDCPEDEKMYLHRIGRTGRAGAAGVAVTLAQHDELERLNVIRKRLGLGEEVVHEVFSTSPLLRELFDLPEETPWDRFIVAATEEPPRRQARKKRKPQRSDGRGKGRQPAAAQRTNARRSADTGRPERAADTSRGADRRTAQRDGDGDTAERVRTRTRTRPAAREKGGAATGARTAQRPRSRKQRDARPRPAREEQPTSQAPDADPRGEGRPTLSRRVKVEHVP